MNDVMEEKLHAVSKVLSEIAESASEKASNLVEANGMELDSIAHEAVAGVRRGRGEAASAAKSQLRSGARKARSGVQGLKDQKEHLGDFGPSAADIRQAKRSIRRFKKSAERQGRDLARTLDEKTGGKRQDAKAKKRGGRAVMVVVVAVGIGFVIARARKPISSDSFPAHPPMSPDPAPATASDQPPPTDVLDAVDSEPEIRAGSRVSGP